VPAEEAFSREGLDGEDVFTQSARERKAATPFSALKTLRTRL